MSGGKSTPHGSNGRFTSKSSAESLSAARMRGVQSYVRGASLGGRSRKRSLAEEEPKVRVRNHVAAREGIQVSAETWANLIAVSWLCPPPPPAAKEGSAPVIVDHMTPLVAATIESLRGKPKQ